MGLCVDIRIDANGDRRRQPKRGCNLAQLIELGGAFDIEAENAFLQRVGHLCACLADAGENDAISWNTGGASAAQFAFGDDVHAGAEAGERGENGLVRVGLHGEANEMILIGEGLREDLEVTLDGGTRIAIERRADFCGDGANIDAFGVEGSVAVGEMMHGRRRSSL